MNGSGAAQQASTSQQLDFSRLLQSPTSEPGSVAPAVRQPQSNMSFNDGDAASMNLVDCAIPAAGAASPGVPVSMADLGIFETNDK